MPTEGSGNPPTIPGYRILGFAGRGAFGTVWFAEECVTGSRRAIKLIPKAADRLDLQREIQGVRRYQQSAGGHANLEQVHHVGESEYAWYYVMDAADPFPGPGEDGGRRQCHSRWPLCRRHEDE